MRRFGLFVSTLSLLVLAACASSATGPGSAWASSPRPPGEAAPPADGENRPSRVLGSVALPVPDEPFVSGADYDPAVPSLESLLGFAPGSRPASPEQIERCLGALAAASPRLRIERAGRTHEGRELLYAIVGSPEDLARLPGIEAALARLATGGGAASRADAETADLPAVLWIGGSIHGDEASGADALLTLAHHLAADRSARTRKILENALLLIEPMENPDGRAHFLSQVEQWGGRVPSLDPQGIPHRAAWPSARGNHYQLDLNRDWFALSQPETRAAVGVLLRWHPQMTIDLHEMGSSDTYLMSPPREPLNPNVPAQTRDWWRRFSLAQAQAFGEHGWSCYTGDWNEEFSPNRGASWTLHTGAVAILEEQAGTDGTAVTRADGTTLTYRDAVRHHFVATLAVIESAADARADLLRSYVDARREARAGKPNEARAFIVDGEKKPEAARRLARTLRAQGIEVQRALESFRAREAVSYWGDTPGDRTFPAGTYIVDLRQPEGRLARAILEFDTPLGSEFLTEERRRLESNESSLLYDASGWCLGMAGGVDVYSTRSAPAAAIRTARFEADEMPEGEVLNPEARYGFLLNAAEEGATASLAALLAASIPVWAADERFTAAGRGYPIGSILVRRAECGSDLPEVLRDLARRTGARFEGIDHALSDAGPDLGSRRFHLLRPPRVAILAGAPFYESTFGALWFLLDQELGLPCTLLRQTGIGPESDLDRYNVILVPDASPGKGAALVASLGPEGIQALQDWVRRGGTLITLGEGNWILFGGTPPFGGLRAQQQVLGEIEQHREAARREIATRTAVVDEEALRRSPAAGRLAPAPTPPALPAVAVTLERHEWLRRFSPPGAILRVDLDPTHWLCAGAGDRVPAMVKTDLALQSRQPVETVGRFADAPDLKLSGLLWPEARERWALSSYLTRERIGDGQAISFLGNPYYRATFYGTGRLLENAILLGPGMGAKGRAGRE